MLLTALPTGDPLASNKNQRARLLSIEWNSPPKQWPWFSEGLRRCGSYAGRRQSKANDLLVPDRPVKFDVSAQKLLDIASLWAEYGDARR